MSKQVYPDLQRVYTRPTGCRFDLLESFSTGAYIVPELHLVPGLGTATEHKGGTCTELNNSYFLDLLVFHIRRSHSVLRVLLIHSLIQYAFLYDHLRGGSCVGLSVWLLILAPGPRMEPRPSGSLLSQESAGESLSLLLPLPTQINK